MCGISDTDRFRSNPAHATPSPDQKVRDTGNQPRIWRREALGRPGRGTRCTERSRCESSNKAQPTQRRGSHDHDTPGIAIPAGFSFSYSPLFLGGGEEYPPPLGGEDAYCRGRPEDELTEPYGLPPPLGGVPYEVFGGELPKEPELRCFSSTYLRISCCSWAWTCSDFTWYRRRVRRARNPRHGVNFPLD